MDPNKDDTWESESKAVAAQFEKFVKSYLESDSKQPVQDNYTRGYYTAIFHTLQAAPALYLLLKTDTRATLDKVKRLMDEHYDITDNRWPPRVENSHPQPSVK